DAVAKASRLGPVVEHVAQVSLARGAAHLGARHEEAPVGVLVHGGALDGLPEARPPGAGVELRLRLEERRASPCALVDALLLRGVVLAGEGALRAVLPQHPVLLGRQALLPLLIAQDDLVAHRYPSLSMSHSSG